MDKKYEAYRLFVLAYFRSEWTDISADDNKFKLLLSRDLDSLIQECYMGAMNVPNAADLVRTYLGFGQKTGPRRKE